MKQGNTNAQQAKWKKEAVCGVLFFTLLQGVCALLFGGLCLIPDLPRWLFVVFFALAALCLVMIPPAFWMLKARFKEIEGGELDAAGQY